MKIIGCDFHPSFQQIAMVDTETGEQTERRLTPSEAVEFYGRLQGPVLVGMEACGNTLWFERLLAGLGTSCGWEMPARSGPRRYASRRPTAAMRNCCYGCCWKGGFRGCGCRAWSSGTHGNCWCTDTSW
jgi:hypothetical protein